MPDPQEGFPENVIRGIVSAKHIIEETGGVSFDLFMPNTKTAANREDRGEEVSINWEDNELVMDFTLTCRDEHGNYRFPNGAVRIKFEDVVRINKLPTINNTLSLERRSIDDNPYHGNIVYRSGLSERVKKMIANYIALHVSPVTKRN